MSTRLDILLDDELDLRENEDTFDFVEGESTKQHQQLLLLCQKGSFKETPSACVGLATYLENESRPEMFAEIRRQFIADGMDLKAMIVDKEILKIDAPYK